MAALSEITQQLRAAGCVDAEDEARLLMTAAQTPAELAALVERRQTGLPIEHVLGWAQFCGLRMEIEPGVFVPRPRTEFLVQLAVALAPPRPVVVDLCCGSGAVGAAVAASLDRVTLYAVDCDPSAVRCARRNVAAGRVYQGDLYQPLAEELRGNVDMVVANAPYVPTRELTLLPAEARLHEPRATLDGGADGLDILRRIISSAPLWLAPGGHLLMESSARQAPGVADVIVGCGLTACIASSDELVATVVIAT
jgi:release factor glutamine methyltransferase